MCVFKSKPKITQTAPRTGLRMKKSATFAAVVVAAVGGFEGYRSSAYLDPVGIPTICFGETKGVKMGMTKTRAECEAMLADSLAEHEVGMEKCLSNHATIPDKPYGAFLSLTYNIGTGAFCGSTVRKRAEAGDLKGACNAIMSWNKATFSASAAIAQRARGETCTKKADGKYLCTMSGLTKRRDAERAMCLEGL